MVNEFQNIFKKYVTDRQKFITDETPRILDNYSSAVSIRTTIPEILERNILGYTIKGSTGNGNMSFSPWIGIFDRSITNSAQTGYYIVYLFDSKMEGVYLSLNQGWTQYRDAYGTSLGKKKIYSNAQIAQERLRSIQGFDFDPINLNPRNSLYEGYQLGNILSLYYPSDNLPSELSMLNDLHNMKGVYRELKGLIGNDILKLEGEKKIPSDPAGNDNNGSTSIDEEKDNERVLRINAAITGKKGEEIFEENAKRLYGWDVVNVSDTHNLGYDFKCENPELYIEVKGCKNQLESIRMTKTEWEVAKEKQNKYKLIIVERIEGEEGAFLNEITNPYQKFNDSKKEYKSVVVEYHINKNSLLEEIK